MKALAGIFFGCVFAVAATFIHNLWPPLGLMAAIAGTFFGIRYLGQIYFERQVKILATVAWTLVVMRASSIGNGDELLITGSNIGSTFVVVGFASAVIATALKP